MKVAGFPRRSLTSALAMAKPSLVNQDESRPSRHITREVRQRVWQRYDGRCAEFAATSYLEFDHIVPVAKGGCNSDTNVQLLCRGCNSKKSDRIWVPTQAARGVIKRSFHRSPRKRLGIDATAARTSFAGCPCLYRHRCDLIRSRRFAPAAMKYQQHSSVCRQQRPSRGLGPKVAKPVRHAERRSTPVSMKTRSK